MLASLLILLLMPILDTSRLRGSQFRPIMKVLFWSFVGNFFILMLIGSQHVSYPYVEIGSFATVFYFSWFLLFVPLAGVLENTLMDLSYVKNH